MTWSVQDPSLSHATSRAIRNIVGYPGAIGADLLMQILGLGSIMLILPVAVWGWRMLTHRHFDREALRIGCWILGTVIAAGFASCWSHGGAWPLPTGVGGVVGDALVRAPAVVFGPPGFIYRFVLGIVLCAAMIAAFLMACGFGSREPDAETAALEDDEAPFEEDDDRGCRARRRRAPHRSTARSPTSAVVPARRWRHRAKKRTTTMRTSRKRTTNPPPALRARRPRRARRPASRMPNSSCRRSPCSPHPRLRTASR
jgi:hypothetical protein